MERLEKTILAMANEFIEQATDSETYSYEREIKLSIAHDIIKKLLEGEDGDQVDKDVH